MRIGAIGAAATLAMCVGTAQAQTVDESKRGDPKAITVREAMLRTGIAAAQKNDCETARKGLDPALADPGADGLPRPLLLDAWEAATACAYNTRDMDTAYDLAMRATGKGFDSFMLWTIRLAIESERKSEDLTVATIEGMAKRAPKALGATRQRWLYYFANRLKDEKKDALRRRLLKVMTSDAYVPTEAMATRDGFMQHYAEILFAEGDKTGAAALVRQITEPWIVLELSFDPRFRAMLPADLDLRAVVVRHLERAKTAMAEHPELLNPILIAAAQQRMLGDPKTALTTLEAARNVIDSPEAYEDSGEQLNWWWDGMSRTYAMLGRRAEAEAALRSGSTNAEDGMPNVSQLINLAQRQLATAPKEALVTLAPFSERKMPVSPYGEAEMRYARGCANALTGNRAAAAEDLAYIEARAADHPQALTNLLLCMGEMDRAAAVVIRRLDNADERPRALILLSEFDDPPAAAPIDPVDSRLPALRARPDVHAAILRAGGTRRIHLQTIES